MKLLRILAVGVLLLCLISCQREAEDSHPAGSDPVWRIDYIKAPDIDVQPCHEVIYEDEDYFYILGNLESQYYIVTYANGETQNIKEALAEGNITLADLDAYGVHYGKTEKTPADSESKEVERITDNSGGQVVLTVEERFYEDYSHIYLFGCPISQYITVTYTDGTEQNVKDALLDGHIIVADLDRFGISYFAEPKHIKDIIYHSDRGGEPDALEGFYADDTYSYYFPSIRSHVVMVYYQDGTEQNVKEALAEGKIRISDLDWFGISYYKKPLPTTEDEVSPMPGGTSADEAFYITVSYANYTGDDRIYTSALNTQKMYISSVRHLPVYRFDTLGDLERFKENFGDVLTMDRGYDEVPSFREATAKYDSAFFAENTLMLVYVSASSGSYRYGVESVFCDGQTLSVQVEQSNRSSVGTAVTCDMAGWFITVAVPDSMAAGCTEFDAALVG